MPDEGIKKINEKFNPTFRANKHNKSENAQQKKFDGSETIRRMEKNI